MSAAADVSEIAVTKPGQCKREVLIGKKKHTVKHSWKIHVCEVELVTTLVSEKPPHRTLNKKTSYVINTEKALSSKAEEMSECVLKNRRDQFMRLGGGGSSSSSSKSKKSRKSADKSEVPVCPIISALRSARHVAGKSSAGVAIKPPADPPAKKEMVSQPQIEAVCPLSSPAFVAAMKKMTADSFLRLMESQGVEGATDLRRERQEGRELMSAMKSALGDAKVHGRTVEGRRAFQTILTAAAYETGGGRDVGGYKPSTTPVTAKRMAEILDVHPDFFSVARKRAKRLRADIAPSEAIDEGAYWYQPRIRRCDAASPELMQLMERFWHTDAVSRPSGDPDNHSNGDSSIYGGADSPGSPGHPLRELILPRGGEAVYSKFLGWDEFIRFKVAQGEDFSVPGRTLFLSTRCKCLAIPTRAKKPSNRAQN